MGFIKKALPVIATGGLSLLAGKGGIKDALLGKEQSPFDPTKMSSLDPSLRKSVEIGREAQQTGLRELLDAKGGEEGIVRGRVAREVEGTRAAGEDAQRGIREAVAQRGLGRSSVGLGLEKGVQERTARQAARTTSGTQERIDALKRRRSTQLLQAGSSALASPGAQRAIIQGREKGRKGGLLGALLPIAGAALGGMSGGAKGAGAGLQAGSGISSALSNL